MPMARAEAGSAVPSQSGAIAIRKVEFEAPWNWLAAGWRDLFAVPKVGFVYGAVFAAAAALLASFLLAFDRLPLLLPLAGGFLLLGPFLAIGLYEVSREREVGRNISLREAMAAAARPGSQFAFIGVILLIFYFLWIRLAFLLLMLFFGLGPLPPISEFVPWLLFTPTGLGLLVTGAATGAVLAVAVFAMTAISVPMLLDRPVDAVTAMAASVRSVIANPKTMALWAILIAAMIAIGCATLFLGLIVVFPLVGHASWHAYRDLTGTAD